MQRARYEAAAREAQRMLDEVVPSLADAVEQMIGKPSSQAALKAVRGFMADIDRAADMMTQVASRPNASDIEALVQNMQEPITMLVESARRGDLAMTGKMIDVIKGNVAQQLALADSIIRHTEDPALRASLQSSVADAKRNIAEHLNSLSEVSRMAALEPNNLKLMDAMQRHAERLVGSCANLVTTCSVGNAEEILLNHQSLLAEQQRLTAAIQAGDRKEAVAAMRAVRRLLNDQLNAAKAIARTTDDPELKAALDAVCANAQKNIDNLMGRLANLIDTAISDPTNLEALNSIGEAFSQAEAISAKIVAACGADLLGPSSMALQEKLNALEEEIMRPNAHAAVAALKAVLAETGRQVEVAKMVAHALEEQDAERATRVTNFADALSSATPALVAASKAALTSLNDATATDVRRNADKVKDLSISLVAAATMRPEDELLENAASLNAAMAKLVKALDDGQVLEAEQISDIVKKMAAQVKLAALVAGKTKDPKSRDTLLKASQTLSKLVGAMVAACKDAMADPNNPATRAKLKGLLADVLAANKDTFLSCAVVGDEELQAAADDLQARLATLETAFKQGTAHDVEVALRNVETAVAKQAFLAQTVADKIEDADRKKQLVSGIAELQKVAYEIAPVFRTAKANPADAAAQRKAATLMDQLRAASHNVVMSATSSPEERMAERALAIGSRLEDLEFAVAKGNTAEANAAYQEVNNAIAQQIRAARAAAAVAPPANKAVLLSAAATLEKLSADIGTDLKAALAKDKAAAQKLTANIASTRAAIASIVANVAHSNKLPTDQAVYVATAMKNDLHKLTAAIATNNPKVIAEAVTQVKKGALLQQAELVRAYASKVDDPASKRAVNEALDDLDKLLTGEFATALSAAQAKPGDSATISRVGASAQAASALLGNVISASTLSPEDRVAALALSAAQELAKVEGAVKKKSEAETVAALNSLKSALSDTAKATRAAAAGVRDPAQKQKLFEAADALDSTYNQVADTALAALAAPSNAEAQKAFAAACEAAKVSLATAVTISTAAPEKQVAKTMIKLAAEIDRLVASGMLGRRFLRANLPM